jgi:hypothetical protein
MPFIVVVKGKKQEEYEAFHSKARARAWAKKMGIKKYEVIYVELEAIFEPLVPVLQPPVQRPQVYSQRWMNREPTVAQLLLIAPTVPVIWLKMKKPREHNKSNNPGYDRWGRNPKNLKRMRRPYQGGLPGQGK